MSGSIPMRKCVGCGEMKEKRSMIRIIKNESGFEIDATGRKNGRGAYLCPSSECLEKCLKGKGIERSFKMSIPDEVKQELIKEVKQLETK